MAVWDRINQADRPEAIFVVFATTVVVLIVIWAVGRDTTRQGGPSVVTFALAGSKDDACAILRRWGSRGQRAAQRSLWIDYVFLLLYTMLISLTCAYLAIVAKDASFWPWLAPIVSWVGVTLTWLALLAGIADAVENTALLMELPDRPIETAARVARLAASTKFFIISVCLLYAGLVRGFSWLLVSNG